MSATRALLSTSRLMVVPRRGKALANWARPSIDEMGVPTESWKQVYIHLQSLVLTCSQLLFYYDEQTNKALDDDLCDYFIDT